MGTVGRLFVNESGSNEPPPPPFFVGERTQIVVDDEHGPLGPGGTRALMTAIMGTGQVLTKNPI